MLASLTILGIGFLLGMRHATDADHVLAVTTIVSRQRSLHRAAMTGALWGLGHTLTLLTVGGAMIVFRLSMPAWLGLSLELLVAAMLVGLGVANLVAERTGTAPAAPQSNARPVVVGTVHGMAGSAAFTLLALPLIGSPALAGGYLLLFGFGTIAGMVTVTFAIALPALYATARLVGARRAIRLGAGVASIAVGCWLAFEIGFVEGLFTGAPEWSPK